MKLLILLASLATLQAQQPVGYNGANNPQLPRYQYIAALSSKITVQSCSTCQPAYLESIDVHTCSADSTITFAWNGTAATATAGTLKPISPSLNGKPPDVFTNSNVGAGTTGKTFPVSITATAANPQSYLLPMFMVLGNAPTSQNWSVGVASGTCTFQLTFRTLYQ